LAKIHPQQFHTQDFNSTNPDQEQAQLNKNERFQHQYLANNP